MACGPFSAGSAVAAGASPNASVHEPPLRLCDKPPCAARAHCADHRKQVGSPGPNPPPAPIHLGRSRHAPPPCRHPSRDAVAQARAMAPTGLWRSFLRRRSNLVSRRAGPRVRSALVLVQYAVRPLCNSCCTRGACECIPAPRRSPRCVSACGAVWSREVGGTCPPTAEAAVYVAVYGSTVGVYHGRYVPWEMPHKPLC